MLEAIAAMASRFEKRPRVNIQPSTSSEGARSKWGVEC